MGRASRLKSSGLAGFVALLFLSSPALAFHPVIHDDRSAFAGVPGTLLDFETRADGTDPFDGFSMSEGVDSPTDEYAAQGFVVEGTTPVWIRIFRDGFPEVLEQAGSPDILFGIAATNSTVVELQFTTPLQSVGFLALSTRLAFLPAPDPTELRFYDQFNELIVALTLDGPLLDGTIGDIEFGYMGVSTFGDRLIDRMEVIRPRSFGIDDLFMSSTPVPAPGGVVVMGVGVVALGGRRR